RGPWRFPAGLSHRDMTFSEPGIEARITARELRTPDRERGHPGFDLPGMEVRAVARTEPYTLRGEDFEALQGRFREWALHRMSGAALVGYPGDGESAGAEWGG